ncbi:MAG: hypothetical protein QNL93_04025 [Opitutae bacterium]
MPFLLVLIGFAQVNAQEKNVQPRAVFSAVFWEKYNSESFSYAPWGNETESNASMTEISVGSSSLSRKFVYYGEGKLNFYVKRRPREWEVKDTNKSNEQLTTNLAAEFDLPQSNDGTQEFLLLFVNKKKNGLWKIYPIPFSKNEVPLGNYKFISQSRNPLYLIFGAEKFTLPSGKIKVSPAVLEEGKRGVLLKVMIQRNARYIEVFNQKWGHSSTMRGVFFLGLNGNKLKVKRVTEFEQPLSSASGYGVPSVRTKIDEDSQNEEVDL